MEMQRICRSLGKHEEKHVLTLSTLITIVIVALLLLSIALVLVSVARADIVGRTFTKDGGVVTYNNTLDFSMTGTKGGFTDEPNKILVFEGEKINFENATTGAEDIIVTGPYDYDGDTKSGCKDYPQVTKNTSWDCSEDNYYFKVCEVANLPDICIGGWFCADKQSFRLELEKKEKVRERENFNLTMKKNNRREGVMKLTIEDAEGYSIMNESGTDIYEILIEYKNDTKFSKFYQEQESVGGISFEDNKLVFNTSELDMKEGKYKIILEDHATEAEDDVTMNVEKIYLEVECDEVVMGRDIIITIKSSFYEEDVNITVEDIYENKPPLTLDEEGKKRVKIPTENVDYGTYMVTVEVCGMKETKYVTLKREGSSLEVPDNATVGDIVHIGGSSDFGDLAVLVIDDVFKGDTRISDDKFEWDWDTSGELGGYREIEVFIVNESFSEELVSEEWQKNEGVDASATIFLLLPMFSMNVPEDIAEDDDVVISGTAIGADHIYIIVINYKGEVVFPPGENARTTPVEEGTWEEKIRDLDTGRYVVISMDKGRDEETYAMDNGVWAAGDESKTMEQRVAILEAAITSAGSDDMFELAYFSVSTPQVSLDLPETAEVDDELRVTAETNIKTGEKAFVSLSQNASVLKKTFTLVENGSVAASINTSGLLPGRYNIAVDVSGRAHDAKE
ncbi:hypothetical protein C5S30_07690, partial [ANME-1 cluster archaeon GoMg4]|nr:hypothetical protein [ANME-1 cluster archaeon GoMg4]